VPKIVLPVQASIDLLYQTAARHCEQFKGSLEVCVWHASPRETLNSLKVLVSSMVCQQNFKADFEILRSLGLDAVHDVEGDYDLALLLPYKNKQQTLFYMAKAMQRLKIGGCIIMACANVHGAKSYQHALASLAGHANGSSKSKCRIFSACKTTEYDENLAQQWLQAGDILKLKDLDLYSQAGLFSWNRADIGSKMLLSHLPNFSGEGMDLCCGYGLLSVHLLQTCRDIQCLHLLDAEWQALRCAEMNTETWKSQCVDHYLDARRDVLPNKLDWVVCNPPFHTGQIREVGLGQEIVSKGCQSLKQGGEIWMVANRQLPYEQLLGQHLREHRIVQEAQGFKIIRGVR